MGMAIRLRFSERQVQGPWFHLTTIDSRTNRLVELHDHDYAEIAWLDAGSCEHLLNGRREMLQRGDLLLLRPRDVHRMWEGRRSFRFTNLSLAPELFRDLRRRHQEEWQALYTGAQPWREQLGDADLETIAAEARALAARPHSRLAVEHLVTGIWLRCLHSSGHHPRRDLPDWLQQALLRIEEPECFVRGVPGLVDLAARSAEHLSRECRRHLGLTPSQVVNRARMRHAAYQLRMTTRSVTAIAADCGFDDPGRFYRLFRQHYATTPGRYRRE